MRRTISILTILALLAALSLALVACGSGGTAAKPTTTLSPEELVKQSMAKTSEVKSASFAGEVALKLQGDAGEADPTTQAMLGQGLSLRVKGKSSESPVAAEMDLSLDIAGQTLEFVVKAKDDKAWIRYEDKWYEVDKEAAQGLKAPSSPGADPTGRLKDLGIDPDSWGATYELAGTEDLNGTWVHHVKASVDPKQLADSLLKSLKDPALAEQLGQNGAGGSLGDSLKSGEKGLRTLRKSLKEATAEFWIGADDMLMRKVAVGVVMDASGQSDDELKGLDGVTVSGTLSLSGFGEPVSVTPPEDALPFSQLMNAVFGGMFGGMMGGSTSGTSF